MLWLLLIIFDFVCFLPCAATVAYLLFFALMSMRRPVQHRQNKNRSTRALVIINSLQADEYVMPTVESVLAQDYREQDFDVIVVSWASRPVTNLRLKQHRLTLICPDVPYLNRTGSVQAALDGADRLKLYDMAVVLEAGDIVERTLLTELSRAYRSGSRVIQCHRRTANIDTPFQALGATFEEINNAIFRQGHITIGFASALSASGAAFDYGWLRTNVSRIGQGGDKSLEALLLRQRMFIDYLNGTSVYTHKVGTGRAFGRQRRQWQNRQRRVVLRHLRYLPGALLSSNYDYADKIIQWLLVPRPHLVAICTFFSLLWPLIYWSLALKWWMAMMLLFLALAIATPDYLVDEHFIPACRQLPRLMLKYTRQQLKALPSLIARLPHAMAQLPHAVVLLSKVPLRILPHRKAKPQP